MARGRHRVLFWLVGVPLLLVVAIVGILSTPPATRFIVNKALPMINRQLNGSLSIREARGSLFGRLDLRGVTVRDPAGTPLATAERVVVGYKLLDFVRGQIKVDPVIIEKPSITLVQNRPGEPYPLLRVFQKDTAAGARASLAVHGLEIRDGAAVMTIPATRRAVGEETRSAEPLLRTVHIRSLNLDLPELSMLSGGDLPLEVDATVDELTAEVTDPRLSLRSLQAKLQMKGDSISFDVKNVEFPETQLSLKGWAVMDTVQRPSFDGQLHVAKLSTGDFTSLAEAIPAGWRVSGDARARGDAAGNLDADLSTFEIVGGKKAGSVRGHLAMAVTPDGRWRQRDTRLEIRNLDLAPLVRQMKRPPAMPISGQLRGSVVADGPQDSLKLNLDLALRQSVRDTVLESRVRGNGEVSLPLGGEVYVRDFTIDTARLEMRALQAMNPAMPLVGRMDMDGKLRGSMNDMAFEGAARYQEASLPPSAVRATVRVTRHSPFHIEAQVTLDSLRLSGLQQSFPSITKTGAIGGEIRLSGPLDTMTIDGNIGGAPGRLRLAGTVSTDSGTITIRNATAQADSINLAAVSSTMPQSFVFAQFAGDARLRGDTVESANVRLALDSSRVGGMTIETASVVAQTGGGLLLLDSLLVRATGLKVDGGGSIGLTDHRGTMSIKVHADSLGHLEPLFTLFGDSIAAMAPHSGAMTLDAVVTGSLKDYALELKADAQQVVTRMAGVKAATVNATWAANQRRFAVRAGVDSLRGSGLTAERVDAAAEGTLESFAWSGSAGFSHNGKVSGSGKVSGDSLVGRTFDLDSLRLTRDSATWRLERPARVELLNERWEFSNTVLVREGPGDPSRVAVTGALTARDSSGRLSAVVDNFPLADLAIYNSTGKGRPLQGTVDARFDLAGTINNPTGRGQFTLLDARYDTLPLPELRARASFLEGVLDANMAIILGSRPSILEAHVPLKRGAGENSARLSFTADSLTVGWLDPLLPTVQDLAGRIDGKVEMTGSFERPNLGGGLRFSDGQVTALALGLHYRDMLGTFSFSGETVNIDRFAMASQDERGKDSLVVTGAIRMETLNDPVLDLRVRLGNFWVMNDETLFKGIGTGDLALKGPFFSSTLSGRANVVEGNAYVDKFVQKRVIDLSDSLFAQFVDTTVLRQEKLGADPITLFIAGLYVEDFDVDLGENFWMKSADANIQLGGELALGKVGKQYTVNGTVSTLRGVYTLRAAPGTAREFQVQQGSIRYFGTPDLNAALDVNADHELQTAAGDPMTIKIHIGGTIEAPSIDLSADVQPPLTESEVISYLIFGAPSFQAFVSDRSGQKRSVFEQSVEGFAGVLSGQLESSLGGFLPLDYFKIKPGEVQSGLSGTELILGKQINLFGKPSWLRASPRICPKQALLSMDQIGLSIETKLTAQWGVAASLDPLRGCETALPPASSHYGMGLDVFWQKRGLSFKRGKRLRR